MHVFRRISVALLAICLSASLLDSAARAAEPATVTVRVEGASHTLVPPTEVSTTTATVVKDGNVAHSCPGTSAAGALQLATSGDWSGMWFSGLGYSVETIAGESHLFEAGVPANYFWTLWLDNKPSSSGVCGAELNPGDSILLFPECFSEAGACPPAPNPLGVTATPGVVEVGAPVSVTVTSYANGNGAPSAAAGATVQGAGVSGKADSNGHATMTFSTPGRIMLDASLPGSVRTETTICVHNGLGGTCGTTAPPGSPADNTRASGGVLSFTSTPYTGPYAVVARATGLIDGHVYSRRHAPRVLTGSVLAHTGLTSVSIELRRSYRGHCHAYDGIRELFVSARCGRGSFFKVSTEPRFSYLLPSALPPGRYVLDIEATDAAGNRTRLARGTSRIVFYVG
jgi:hypothetical protein